MKTLSTAVAILAFISGYAQSYPSEAGLPGSTAIFVDSPLFVGWATGITVMRGYVDVSNPATTAGGSNLATAGTADNALGYPNGATVSLGDGGSAILTFANPITNDDGFDFAVFENGSVGYLELAFVEASSDGIHFVRFPSHSQTQTATQLGTFGTPSAAYLNNLAGKYSSQYGTPFDISDLPDDDFLDRNTITHIKIIDVVGSISPLYASYDSFGNAVNDSFPTPFVSGGFDLQAVGIIHQQSLATAQHKISNFSVWPNPVDEILNIKGIPDFEIKVFDSSGRKLMQQHGSDFMHLDVSSLAKGLYLLELRYSDKTETIHLAKK